MNILSVKSNVIKCIFSGNKIYQHYRHARLGATLSSCSNCSFSAISTDATGQFVGQLHIKILIFHSKVLVLICGSKTGNCIIILNFVGGARPQRGAYPLVSHQQNYRHFEVLAAKTILYLPFPPPIFFARMLNFNNQTQAQDFVAVDDSTIISQKSSNLIVLVESEIKH